MEKIYDINSLPSDFLCFFCHKLLQDPLTCAECLSVNFCSKCLDVSRQNLQKCPQCNAIWSDGSFKSNPMIIKIFEFSEVKCPNKECVWIGKFKNYYEHQKICFGMMIECPMKKFGCKWEDDSKKLEEHRIECVFGKLEGFFENLEKKFMKMEMEKDEQIAALKMEMNKMGKEMEIIMQKIGMTNDDVGQKIMENKGMEINQINTFPLSGILHHVSFSHLLTMGFKIGLCEPYSYVNSFEEMIKFRDKKFVLVGGRRKKNDYLILAALATGQTVFKETFHERETNYENGVYWYFFKGHSMGFSHSPNVLVK